MKSEEPPKQVTESEIPKTSSDKELQPEDIRKANEIIEMVKAHEKSIQEHETRFNKLEKRAETLMSTMNKQESHILLQILSIMSLFFTIFVAIDIGKGFLGISPKSLCANHPIMGISDIVALFLLTIFGLITLQYCFICALDRNFSLKKISRGIIVFLVLLVVAIILWLCLQPQCT